MFAIVGLLAITRGALCVCPRPGLLTHLPLVGHRPILASRQVLAVGLLPAGWVPLFDRESEMPILR